MTVSIIILHASRCASRYGFQIAGNRFVGRRRL
jgi:hypothetical protein